MPDRVANPPCPRTARAILHADLDAFFAAVEQLDRPELRGRPVLVGGTGSRGVVSTASYEARVFGCRSAQPMAVARQLCPHAEVVKPRGGRYRELADAVFEIYRRYTPIIQPLSIDEAFLDVTGSVRLHGEPRSIGEAIRRAVNAETGLTVSVGVAPNKFLAKLASDLRKPDALVEITAERLGSVLAPLPITAIPGVGPAAERRFHRRGIRTLGDVRAHTREQFTALIGIDHAREAARVHDLAHGFDDRPVRTDRQAKSISHERTFGENLSSPDDVRRELHALAEQVARRLRRAQRSARTVTMKIRDGDFRTQTRAVTLPEPGHDTPTLTAAAMTLFDGWRRSEFRPVRLIGIGVSHLTDLDQPGLFHAVRRDRDDALDRAADAIAQRFGPGAITRAASLAPPDADKPTRVSWQSREAAGTDTRD